MLRWFRQFGTIPPPRRRNPGRGGCPANHARPPALLQFTSAAFLPTDHCPLFTAHDRFKSFSCILMDLPASVANKRLTAWLSPLDATITKNRGRGERVPKP